MADPVSWAIATIKVVATTVSAFAASHPIVWAAAKLAASVAVSSAVAGKPKLDSGTSLDFQADLNAGVPLAMGRTAVGANLAHQYPYGKKNRMLSLFCLLSLGPIQQIESFKADEQLVTFNASGVVTNNPSFKDQMFMTTRLGATPDTALPQPGGQATADGTFTQWTSAHKLSGLASAWWVCQYDSDKLNSLPQPQWVLKGVKCYDPRKDSTYPGGSGSHRSNNPATFEFTENPGLLALQWVLGYWQNGKKVAGVGSPIDGIDVAAFVTAANVADANGWKAGGRVTTADSKWQVLKSILQAGGAEPCMLGARISCIVSAPKTSLATLNTGDLAGAPRVQAMISRRERKNTLTPRYRSETHKWEMVPAAPVSNPTYVTEDGGTLSDGLDLPLVQATTQAGQLTAYAIVNAREFQPIILPVKPRWMGYQPGDCITVNIPEIGLNGQKCVILRRTRPDPQTGIVSLTLRSETDAKHAYALGTSAVAPPSPGLTIPDFATVDAPAVGQWTATATAQVGGGASVPCITLTGSASDYPFAASIIVEYKLHSSSDWLMWGSSPASSTSITIAGLGGSLPYDVAVSYKSIYGVTGPRTVLGPVTTLAGYGVASTILNQGSLATANNVTYGDGTIKETAGGTTATLLNFKTPLGTAAAITGQGAFATVNSAAYGSSLLTGFAALAAQANLYFGSSLLLESSGGAAATLANFKTLLGIASGITGQGALATSTLTASQVTNTLVQTGANAVVNSTFNKGVLGWSYAAVGTVLAGSPTSPYSIAATGLDWQTFYTGARHVFQTAVSSSGVAIPSGYYVDCLFTKGSWSGSVSDQKLYGLNVKQGSNIYARALIATHRCLCQVYVLIFNAAGTLIELNSVTGTGTSGGAAGGDPANFTELAQTYTVTNAGAVSASIVIRMLTNGGADPYVFVTEPALGLLPAGQTVVPPYTAGPSDPLSDQTSTNTAAAIAGQGAFATFNQIALNTTYIKMADGTTIMTESLVKTSIGIAAAITGQGDLATQNKNAVDFTAGKIAISSGMMFVDASQTSVPLRSSASIRSTWSTTDFNSLANRTVVAGSGSWAVPVFGPSSSYSFKNDSTTAYDVNMRVRTGTVRFKARASALVYGHLSIWYRVNSSGPYIYCDKTTNTWTDDMNISVEWLGDITLAAGDYIQFYVGICDSAGNLRNGTFRNFTGAQCTIEAVNW